MPVRLRDARSFGFLVAGSVLWVLEDAGSMGGLKRLSWVRSADVQGHRARTAGTRSDAIACHRLSTVRGSISSILAQDRPTRETATVAAIADLELAMLAAGRIDPGRRYDYAAIALRTIGIEHEPCSRGQRTRSM